MVLIAVRCPYCQSDQITKRGKTDTGKQRYRCHNTACPHQFFLLDGGYRGRGTQGFFGAMDIRQRQLLPTPPGIRQSPHTPHQDDRLGAL